MEPNVWQNELKEIVSLKAFYEIESQKILKELDCLADAQNDEVALLYTRRTLEVIVTELCEDKWKKERGSEPLLSIIDRLHRDKFLPDFAHTSMQNLNKIATFGVHPKEFDTNQVRTALLELVTVLKWYAKEKNYKKTDIKKVETKTTIDKKTELLKSIEKIENPKAQTTSHPSPKNYRVIALSGLILFIAVTIVVILKILPEKKITENIKTLNKPHTTKALKADTAKKTSYKTNIVKTQEPKPSEVVKATENKAFMPAKEEPKVNNIENKPINKESIEALFKKLSNGSLTYYQKKDIIKEILAQCDKNAVVFIMTGDHVSEKKPIIEYRDRLLSLTGIFTVSKKETDSNGKITHIEVSEEIKK